MIGVEGDRIIDGVESLGRGFPDWKEWYDVK